MSKKRRGHRRRWWMASMAARDEVMAETDKNTQRRELGPRRQRLGRQSTGAPTGCDGAAGQQDAGSSVGATCSSAQSEKPDMMPKYCWTGVLECWWSTASCGKELGSDTRCAGGDTQPGLVIGRNRSRTARGDMELSCPLEVLGLQGSHWLLWTLWAVHLCLLREGNLGRSRARLVADPNIIPPVHEQGHKPVGK